MLSVSCRRSCLALTLLCLLAAPALADPQEGSAPKVKAPPETGIRGTVIREDGTGVYGATVRVRNLGASGETATVTAATDAKGDFKVVGLEHGYYDLVVDTDAGSFIGNRVVNVPPGGFGVIQLRLGPVRGEIDNSTFGTEASEGMASVERKLNRREFWRSPKGVGLLAGVGGVALLALAASDESNPLVASPINP